MMWARCAVAVAAATCALLFLSLVAGRWPSTSALGALDAAALVKDRRLAAKPADWVVTLKEGTSDEELQEICAAGADEWSEASYACLSHGHPGAGGIAFVVMRATESQLHELSADRPGTIVGFEQDASWEFIPELPAEPDRRLAASSVSSWGLDRIDDRLGLDGSYDSSSGGGTGVHVYVVDTGIRTSHTDFITPEGLRRAVPTLEVLGSGPVACNADDASCAADGNGHGTHCAGTIGGNTYGVAKNVTLHAVKVLSDSGGGQFSWFIAALDWIATNRLRPAVLSASLGGSGNLASVKSAIDASVGAGVTVVVAAGNSYGDACGFTPAFVPLAITVGATDSADKIAGFSNQGACVDIFAPGVGIVSASHGSDSASATLSGTSMACPHVAGAAALLLHADSALSPTEVAAKLAERATVGAISQMKDGSPDYLLYTGIGSTMTTTTTTSTLPDFGGRPWTVTEGPCFIDALGCAQSPNFPEQYGNNQGCMLLVNDSASKPIVVEEFRTEGGYDKLTVNGQRYSGTTGPSGVTPSGSISWVSDHSVTDFGWRLCMEQTSTLAPTPAATPTAAPSSVPSSVPTVAPTHAPTKEPTSAPTVTPTPGPTVAPTHAAPTVAPTLAPSSAPTSTNTSANTTLLAAYWDNGECGPHGNDHNWEWCDRWNFRCQKSVAVSTQLCASGRAVLAHTQTFASDGTCTYAYYAQYECEVFDTRLAAYWDYGSCGPHGDNHNWDWCGTWTFTCPQVRTVPVELCANGTALLVEVKFFKQLRGCPYAYYAQYACGDALAGAIPSERQAFLAP